MFSSSQWLDLSHLFNLSVCVCVCQDLGVDCSPDCSLWTQQHVPVDIISKSSQYGGHLPMFGYQMDQNRQNKEKGIYFSTQIIETQRRLDRILHKSQEQPSASQQQQTEYHKKKMSHLLSSLQFSFLPYLVIVSVSVY